MTKTFRTADQAVASLTVGAAGVSNAWVKLPGAKLYLRLGIRLVVDRAAETLEIANVEVQEKMRGKGIFRQLLLDFERLAAQQNRVLLLENVLSPELDAAMRRRVEAGTWVVYRADFSTSYCKLLDTK